MFAAPTARVPPDLTVMITEDGAGRLAWSFISPHAIAVPSQPIHSSVASNARTFANLVVKSGNGLEGTAGLYAQLAGLGKNIQGVMPPSFWAILKSVISKNKEPSLLILSNEGSEFQRLVAYDLASGQKRDLEKADWDIVYSSYSRDGRYRVTGVNADASLELRIVQTADGKPVTLPKLPGGELRGVTFSKTSQRMAFYLNGDRSPSNLYVYDFGTKQVKQLTRTLSKDIDPEELVEGRIVRFRSFDGMVIPSVYYEPKEASPTNKVPAVVMVHGGPGGQTTRGYAAMVQYLVNHGYAVLGINNRGSSGYGKTFFTADDGKHGREPLWDCIEAKTYLAGTGVIDPERIGIMGGSYGGYMTLAAMAFRPEAFKVGVDIFGVSNWLRTLESIPPYWESFRKALYLEIGDPVKDKDFLIATSPLFHAKEIRKPLLVIQGKNDPRVIKPESDEIVEAVKKNGVPVEYVVFEDEGHGFSKKKNQIEANQKVLEFLDKYLKPGSKN